MAKVETFIMIYLMFMWLLFNPGIVWEIVADAARTASTLSAMALRGPSGRRARNAELADRLKAQDAAVAQFVQIQTTEAYARLSHLIEHERLPWDDPQVKALLDELFKEGGGRR